MSQAINEILLAKINHENQKLETEVKEIVLKLKKSPENIEEMHELRTYAKSKLPQILQDIDGKISSIMNKMGLLDEMRHKLSFDDYSKCWGSYGLPKKLFNKKEKCLQAMINNERVFIDNLMKQQGELSLEIQNIKNDLEILMKCGELENYEKISGDFFDIGERIRRATNEGDIINRREEILNYKTSDYSEIEKIKKIFTPYNKVWDLARNSYFKLPQILGSALNSIDRDGVTQEVLDSWKELFKLEKTTFKLVHHMLKVTTAVRKEFEKFKPYLPLINDLRNPALKTRHWEQLLHIMKKDKVKDNEETINLKTEIEELISIKFNELLKKGVMDLRDQIRDISEIASKELSFEKVYNSIINMCFL